MHKEVAIKSSEVLLKAFTNTAFIEGATQVFELPQTSGAAFQLWMQCVYSQPRTATCICPTHSYMDFSLGSWKPTIREMLETLFQLWYLAEYLLMPTLQNGAIHHICKALHTFNVVPWFQHLDEADSDLEIILGGLCGSWLLTIGPYSCITSR